MKNPFEGMPPRQIAEAFFWMGLLHITIGQMLKITFPSWAFQIELIFQWQGAAGSLFAVLFLLFEKKCLECFQTIKNLLDS